MAQSANVESVGTEGNSTTGPEGEEVESSEKPPVKLVEQISHSAVSSDLPIQSNYYFFIIIRVIVSLLLEEPLSAYCPAMLIFGSMVPVWTYSLFKVILPTSFG